MSNSRSKSLRTNLVFIGMFLFLALGLSHPVSAKVQKKSASQQALFKKVLKPALKDLSKFKSPKQIKSYMVSLAKNPKEAQKIEKLYKEVFGSKPQVKPVNFVKNKVYSDGQDTGIRFKLKENKMLLYKKGRAFSLTSKTKPLHLLYFLKKVYSPKVSQNFWMDLIFPQAWADRGGNPGVGFVLLQAILRIGKEEPTDIFINVPKDNTPRPPNPRENNAKSCSREWINLHHFLGEEFSNNHLMSAKWPDDFAFAFKKPGEEPKIEDYKELAQSWLQGLRSSGNQKDLKCDLSDYPRISINYKDYIRTSIEPSNLSNDNGVVQTLAVTANLKAPVNWFGWADATHFHKGYLGNQPSHLLTYDRSYCGLEYRDVLLQDFSFTAMEACKIAAQTEGHFGMDVTMPRASSGMNFSSPIEQRPSTNNQSQGVQ